MALRDELLERKGEDLRVREELARTGELFQGYNPRMEEVHRRNATFLRDVVERLGWPGKNLVGEDGAEAAWMILQHAIGEPGMQRGCLPLLRQKVAEGEIPAWQAAYLEDRICFFEGRPQIYGTQFDHPVVDPDHVTDRRAAVGLPPLDRELPLTMPEPDPGMVAWAIRTGWR